MYGIPEVAHLCTICNLPLKKNGRCVNANKHSKMDTKTKTKPIRPIKKPRMR